jgi:hypothetical protein
MSETPYPDSAAFRSLRLATERRSQNRKAISLAVVSGT